MTHNSNNSNPLFDILDSIENNNDSTHIIDLIDNTFTLNQYSQKTSFILLNKLLNHCVEHNRNKLGTEIIQYWEAIDPISDTGIAEMMIDICRSRIFNIDTIRKVKPKEYSTFQMLMDLSKRENEPYISADAAPRIIEIFGTITSNEIYTLYEYARDHGATYLSIWLWNHYVKLSDAAPIPKFIKDFKSYTKEEQELMKSMSLKPLLKPRDLQRVYEESNNYKIDESLLSSLGIRDHESENEPLTEEQQKTLFKKMHYSLVDDNDKISLVAFARYGPLNPFLNQEHSSMDSGRMRLSNMYDFDPDTESREDWYEGHCWQTGDRILHREYAVRIPMPNGGWWGCFASWNAAYKYIQEHDQSNAMSMLLINYFEQQSHEYGLCGVIDE